MKNEKPEGLTRQEKRILLGESTFVSVGFVVILIGAVVFTMRIDGKANANARANDLIISKQDKFETQYLKQMQTLNTELQKMNTRLGRIEGALKAK